MSLTNALISAKHSILLNETRISVSSTNVQNADREGYTRKSYETDYTSTNGTTFATQGTIVSSTNRFLTAKAIESNSELGYAEIIDGFMQQYDQALGSTDGENSLTTALDELVSALDSLSVTADFSSEKINVVQAADDLAYQLNQLSAAIQDLRGQADTQISQTVGTINDTLEALDQLNDAIVDGQARGVATADMEDERLKLLEELSGMMDVQYHFTDDGRLQLYTSSGNLLLGSDAHLLSFTPTSMVNGSTAYPGTLSGITLDGVDVTSSMTGGEMGGLLTLRDDTLVEEQAKLNEFATELMEAVNALHNQGASIPSPVSLAGSFDGLTGAESLAGSTGTFRIAATDASGNVQEFLDIDLTTITDVNALVAAIDAMANIDATLDANGAIVISSTTSGLGVSLSEMDGDVTGSGEGVSSYFGLNDLFAGSSAENIHVREEILDNPDYLAAGALSTSATLAVGDAGILPADASVAQSLTDLFSASNSFDAAGDFTARQVTFQSYLSSLISSAALKVEVSASDYSSATEEYDAAKTALTNATGINVDEEMMKITIIQEAYDSTATIISTLQDMFDSLIEAVN